MRRQRLPEDLDPPDEDGPRDRLIGGSLTNLLYMTQLAAISQDPWFSKVTDPWHADQVAIDLDPGDRMVLCTDGAFEIHNAQNEALGQDGFLKILSALDYPRRELDLGRLEEELLKYSNSIRLQDDLTILEVGFKQLVRLQTDVADIATVEQKPAFEGRRLSMTFAPIPGKISGGKRAKTEDEQRSREEVQPDQDGKSQTSQGLREPHSDEEESEA